jgi:hypothetical protein
LKVGEAVFCYAHARAFYLRLHLRKISIRPDLINQNCREQVQYYEISVYSTKDPHYKWVLKYTDTIGAALTASFFLPYEFGTGGEDIVWSVVAYDKSGKKLSFNNTKTFQMAKIKYNTNCGNLVIRRVDGWIKKLNINK